MTEGAFSAGECRWWGSHAAGVNEGGRVFLREEQAATAWIRKRGKILAFWTVGQ